MGCCIKPKIRSATDQHEKNPMSTPRTEKTIRFLNSCRWTRSGMESVRCANPEAAVSDMEGLSDMCQRLLLTEHYWNGATCHAEYQCDQTVQDPSNQGYLFHAIDRRGGPSFIPRISGIR